MAGAEDASPDKDALPPTSQRGAVRGDSSPAAAAQGAHPLPAARRRSPAPAPPLGRSPAGGAERPLPAGRGPAAHGATETRSIQPQTPRKRENSLRSPT
ncbi:hypothetical protein NN561_012769 [Cricetulus griseus]